MRMHEKTMGYVLYFCPNAICKVATFYRVSQCPSCGEAGSLLRLPTTMGSGRPIATLAEPTT